MLTKRSRVAIYKEACARDVPEKTNLVYEQLEAILPYLGEQSHSRSMINRIGYALLNEAPHIVAPSCPDYARVSGRYSFTSVGVGVPYLAHQHIQLLDTIATQLTNLTVEIVVTDLDGDDPALCKTAGLTDEAFLARATSSAAAVQSLIADRQWHASPMSARFPDMPKLQAEYEEHILTDPAYTGRLENDTAARTAMYESYGVVHWDEQYVRTARSAAQHAALAEIANRDGFMVCNSEVIYLSWYNHMNVAVLHNQTDDSSH